MDGNLLMSSGNETTKYMHYITHPHGENSLQGLLQLNSLSRFMTTQVAQCKAIPRSGEGREGRGQKNEQSGGGREKGETGASLPMSFLICSS